MTNNRDTYKKSDTSALPLYFQPFWLDIVAPGKWHVLSPDNSTDRVFVYASHGNNVFMPPLTQFLGSFFMPRSGKYTQALAGDHEWTSQVLQALTAKNIHLQLGTHVRNVLPFIWQGYAVSPRITYTIGPGQAAESVFRDFRENIRREIRKAEKNLQVYPCNDMKQIRALLQTCDLRSTLRNEQHIPVLYQLIEACISRNCGQLWIARDKDGKNGAFAFFASDATSLYYITGYAHNGFKKEGAMSLLMWQGIQQALAAGKVFDFEGSMVPSIERFFRAFGARQHIYFEIRKFRSPLRRFLYWWRILK